MRKRENWLFLFAAIGAMAALVKILEYFGITYQNKGLQPSGGAMPIVSPTSGLIWAILLFIFSLGLSIFGFYVSNRRRRHLEHENLELKSTLEQRGPSLLENSQDQVQFYQGRAERVSFKALSKRGNPIFVATHVAGTLANSDDLQPPVERLLLQNPDSVVVDLMAGVVLDRKATQIREQIRLSIEVAKQNQVEVRLFDGPMTSVIIGKPTSKIANDGWAQIESFLPRTSATSRPCVLFEQRRFPQAFAAVVRMFDEMWENTTAGGVSQGITDLRTKLENAAADLERENLSLKSNIERVHSTLERSQESVRAKEKELTELKKPSLPEPAESLQQSPLAQYAMSSLLGFGPQTPEQKIKGLESEKENLGKEVESWKAKWEVEFKDNIDANLSLASIKIQLAGCDSKRLDPTPSVLIQFMGDSDLDRAKEIERPLLWGSPPPHWETRISQIPYQKNPYGDDVRIVVSSSNLVMAKGLADVFNEHKLISEKMGYAAIHEPVVEDVSIIIYREPKPVS